MKRHADDGRNAGEGRYPGIVGVVAVLRLEDHRPRRKRGDEREGFGITRMLHVDPCKAVQRLPPVAVTQVGDHDRGREEDEDEKNHSRSLRPLRDAAFGDDPGAPSPDICRRRRPHHHPRDEPELEDGVHPVVDIPHPVHQVEEFGEDDDRKAEDREEVGRPSFLSRGKHGCRHHGDRRRGIARDQKRDAGKEKPRQ